MSTQHLSAPDVVPQDDGADAAAAFAAMQQKLTLLIFAQEGFATKLHAMHGRDYSEDLARIVERQQGLAKAIEAMGERPAMRATVASIATDIEKAGASVREKDHQALYHARQHYESAVQSIKDRLASARTARQQSIWVRGAVGAGTVFGMILYATFPGPISRSVPESWLWPEKRAAQAMNRSGWDAGVRMMAMFNSQRWTAEQEAIGLVSVNKEAIRECQDKATRTRKRVSCKIEVGAAPRE